MVKEIVHKLLEISENLATRSDKKYELAEESD